MKKCMLILVLSLVLVIAWGVEAPAQTKKELVIPGIHYNSTTSKVIQVDPDRVVVQTDLMGLRVNDSGEGPFHAVSVHLAGVAYRSKGYNLFRGYETWIDKDGDKVIWELGDTPPGAKSSTAKMIEGTGKYAGWQGALEYTLQFPKAFPEGTGRIIARVTAKFVIPQ